MRTQQVTVLIGPVCSGKSTYIINKPFDYVVSSDNIVDELIKKNGISYSQFFLLDFNDPLRKKQRWMFNQSVKRSKSYSNIAWDLTNLTRTNRSKIFKNYPNAIFHAIEFNFQGFEDKVLLKAEKRGKESGKYVPQEIIRNMFSIHEEPTKSEGFKTISNVNIYTQ